MIIELYLNTAYFVDVYLNMKDPFSPSRRRQFKILLFTPVLYTLFFLLIYFMKNEKNFSLVPPTLLGFLSLVSCIATLKMTLRLRMKSTSRQLKSKVIRRTLVYFAVYFLTIVQKVVIFPLTVYWIRMKNYWDDDSEMQRRRVIFYKICIAFDLVGFFLIFVRISEPYVRTNIMADIVSLFGL